MPTPAASRQDRGTSANNAFSQEKRTNGSIGADLLASVAPFAKGKEFLLCHSPRWSDELAIGLQSAKHSTEGSHQSPFSRPSKECSPIQK